jgi:hypothetical protein
MAVRTILFCAVLVTLFLSPAEARKQIVHGGSFVIDGELPRHSCYRVRYVPALYLVNTRGKLVRSEQTVLEGELADGSRVIRRRVPATYLETRVLLEADHYSLSRIPCRGE